MDGKLFSKKIPIERKVFSFELKENLRGRFLRITEDVGGRKDAIVIPATGLGDLLSVVTQAMTIHADAADRTAVGAE